MTRQPYDFVAATFHFFVVVARRPVAALWIAVWQLVLIAAVVAGFLAAYWPLMVLLPDIETVHELEVLSALMQSSGLVTLMSLAAILVSLAAQGAWLRLLTRDEIRPVIPFRLGADELRLFAVNLVFTVFWFVASMGLFVAYLAGAALIGTLGGVGGIAAGALLGTFIVLFGAVALIIVCLRFAAAPALTVHDRQFRLFGAVNASGGVTGMMFLSYLALIAVWIAGATVVSLIVQIALLLAAPALLPAIMEMYGSINPDPDEVIAMMRDLLASPLVMVMLGVIVAVQLLFQIAFEGLWHGVGAYVARRDGAARAAAAPADPATASLSPAAGPAA
jgi:hypothetical protein